MQVNLEGKTLTVLGGDAREVLLAENLVKAGACVKVLGLPVNDKNIVQCSNAQEAVEAADALILPVPKMNEDMKLYSRYLEKPVYIDENLLGRLEKNTPVLVGVASPGLKKIAEKHELNLIEVMAIDETAILNSIPSAEGAVQIAMERMLVTIHGCCALVLGFGRTGLTLARLLKAMGAHTSVAARRPEHMARAYEMGLKGINYHQIGEIKDINVIFNTVPAMVLNKDVLAELPAGTVIVDLASAPGGTDFSAAKELGIDAVLAPGLPGKVAPETAGRVLVQVVTRLLAEEFTLH